MLVKAIIICGLLDGNVAEEYHTIPFDTILFRAKTISIKRPYSDIFLHVFDGIKYQYFVFQNGLCVIVK